MKVSHSVGTAVTALFLASGALPAPAAAQMAQTAWESGKWQFTATVYGWFPTINGKINFPGDLGSTDIHVPFHDTLEHLKMGVMGALDAHNGRWGMFADVHIKHVGGVKSQTNDFSIGSIALPASATTSLSLDLKSVVWTVAGEYRMASDPAWTADLLGGARMLYIKPTLGYSITGALGPIVIPGRDGSKAISETLWDAIIGIKGRYAFGDNREWFVPFYLDVGTGATKLTWQGVAGVGYAFPWGDVTATWRYLDWNAKSGKPIADLNMGGPMLAVAFHF